LKYKVLNLLVVLVFGYFAYWYVNRPVAKKTNPEFADRKELKAEPQKPHGRVDATYLFRVLANSYFEKANEVVKKTSSAPLDTAQHEVKLKLCEVASIFFLKDGTKKVPAEMAQYSWEFAFVTDRRELLCRIMVTPWVVKEIKADLAQKSTKDLAQEGLKIAEKYAGKISFSIY
jgi:hypothetical protein